MKISNLSKLMGASVVAATLTIAPLTIPAQAQDTGSGTYNQPSGEVDAADTEDDGFDWGWLGLLGLAGLAGLAGRKRQETVHYTDRDPHVGVRSGSDYR